MEAKFVIRSEFKRVDSLLFEKYFISDGTIIDSYLSTYLGDNPQSVIDARTEFLNKKFAEEFQANVIIENTKPLLTKYDFMLRFTADERIALRTSQNPYVMDFVNLLNYSDVQINLESASIKGALNLLVSCGLLTQNRANEIGE